jgi:aflatoxin B1 aldehyde reductase
MHHHRTLLRVLNNVDLCTPRRQKYLSKLKLRNATIDTKVFPLTPGDHKPENLRKTFHISLGTLGKETVRVLYLHAPDRSVPFEDTVEEINRLYKEGKL